jgi:Subtilase family
MAAAALFSAQAIAQAPMASGGKGAFITIDVTAPLSDQQKAVLEKLVEPNSTSQLIEAVAKEGTPIRSVCGLTDVNERCPDLTRALDAAKLNATTKPVGWNFDARKFDSFATWSGSKPGTYYVFEADDPVVKAFRYAEPVAVPKDALDATGIPLSHAPLTGQDAVATVEDDLRRTATTERSFRINRALSETEVAALIQSFSGGNVSAMRASQPKNSFSIIQFENTGANCRSTAADWPFDVDRVKTIMQFNADIRRRMKVGPPQRSRILIVDTGIGKHLAQADSFSRLLYAEAAELIAPASVQRDFNDTRCTDANGNGYWRDAYGTGSGKAASDDTRCTSPTITAFDLIDPHPKQPQSVQIYNPDHGSFVSGLAVGGPRFMAAFPQIADYIGLSFFRVPRKADTPALSIMNEFADITTSLDYAEKIKADVINMSLKTDRDEPFRAIKDNPTALLVAAAGNNKENLDRRASENFPASMQLPQMIVVSALQAKANEPLWPDSAFSSTRVQIAAPGADISSFDATGAQICDSGTSAAAPLVSFAAATIKALTGASGATIRARILAAADHVDALRGKVEEGRRLNVEAALDLFVDRVELKDGSDKLVTGWIEPDRTDPLVQVCKDGTGPFDPLKGQIDLALLWEWYRDTSAKINLRYNRSVSEPFAGSSCNAPSGSFKFFDYKTKTRVDIKWSQVQKILPTPFRGAKEFILN